MSFMPCFSCWVLFLGSFATAPPACAAVEAGSADAGKDILIRGQFFENTPEHPLPGALVALYDGASGLLQDQTYTVETGRYVLRLPKETGTYYVVATKDMMSVSQTLTYRQGETVEEINIAYRRTPPNILEQMRSSPGIQPIISFAAGILSGFLISWLNKWYSSRRLFQRQMGRVKGLCNQIKGKREEIDDLIHQHERLPFGDQRRAQCEKDFAPLKDYLTHTVAKIAVRIPDPDVVQERHGDQGYEDASKFRETLDDLKNTLREERLSPDKWKQPLLEQINELVNNPLVKD